MFQLHKSNRLRIYVETLQGEFSGRCLRQLVDLLPPKRVQGAGEEASELKSDKDDQYKVRSFLRPLFFFSLLFSSFLFSSLLFSSSLLLSLTNSGLRLNSVNVVVKKKKRNINMLNFRLLWNNLFDSTRR